MQFFGGEQGETGRQIEAHLPAEHRTSTRAGTVGFVDALFKYMAHQVKIRFHKKVEKSPDDQC